MPDRDFRRLPPRIDSAATYEEVPPYEAVEEIQGVRRVSPLSPVAGIDEARLFATIATSRRVQPWRRTLARWMALAALASAVLGVLTGAWSRY